MLLEQRLNPTCRVKLYNITTLGYDYYKSMLTDLRCAR